MEEPIYDFTFKMKYRKITPWLYYIVFIAAIIFFVQVGLPSAVFIIFSVFGGYMDKQLFLVFLIAFLVSATALFFAVRFFGKEIDNRYVFYDRCFKVIYGENENTFNYSDIVEIKEIKGLYLLYINDNRAFIMGKCFNNVTDEEFEQFLIVRTNIRPKKQQ